MSFDTLGLSEKLLKAINEAGYTEPTPIQAAAIPHALAGRDVLGVAQTGTGKTASFVLPMIEMLSRGRAKARMPRTLILEPTRELAAQVAENFEKYGKHHKLTMALLIGGVSFGDQDRLLTQGVDVLIATPGRLLDHFERGKLLLSGCQILVVDEADRMLDMGFIPDIERIFKLTPFTRQTLFFSATMPPEITRLTEQFLHNPQRVEVSRPASTGANVTQRLVRIQSNDPSAKRAALRAAIDSGAAKDGGSITSAIVFCNRKTEVDVVAKSLASHGYKAAPIHGDLPQSVRTATLAKFKAGDIHILVASDVAARGLDISDVSHVFNYNVPRHADDYVHRIGRTARAGRSGDAITIVSPEDRKSIAAVEALIKLTIPDAEGVTVPEVSARSSEGRSGEGRSGEERAPREGAEGRDGGSRRKRSRRRGGSREGREGAAEQQQSNAPETPAAPVAVAAATTAEAPAPAPQAREQHGDQRQPEQNRDGGRRDGRQRGQKSRDQNRDQQNRDQQNRDQRGRDQNRDQNRGRDQQRGGRDQQQRAPEVAFGEHTPAFLLRLPPAAK